MKPKRIDKIICPVCGTEYLPAEVYLPNELLGRPSDIERDITGKILSFCGKTLSPKETYTCDKCNSLFEVFAKVQFNTRLSHNVDFSTPYSGAVTKPKLFFDED